MSSGPRLPGYLRASRALPEPERAELVSELLELYGRRLRRSGRAAADAWLRRESRRALVHLLRLRLGGSGRSRSVPTARARSSIRETPMNLTSAFRYGARRLKASPTSTATIVLTVALGLGGTTAAFAVVHGVLIEPLPYDDAGELTTIYTSWPDGREWGFSAADYQALEEEQTSFASVAVYDPDLVTLEVDDQVDQLRLLSVTASFFGTLGLRTATGRTFGDEEDQPGSPNLVVASHAFWRDRLGGRGDVVGSAVTIDEEPYTIVGVLAPTAGPLEQEYPLFRNRRLEPPSRKGPFSLRALARLRPGVSPETATAELQAIGRRLFPVWQDSWPTRETTWGLRSLEESIVGDAAASTLVALAAVGLLLVIACTNAASLLVARGLRQRPEIAVRAALGASRSRLVTEMLAESAILAGLGAAAGLGLAVLGIRLATTIGAGFIPRVNEIGLDGSVLLFFVCVTLASLALFGLVPALQSSGGGLTRELASAGRGRTSGLRAHALRRLLVGAEFAVTAPLLIGAALLLVSLGKLLRVDPGYDAHRLLTAHVTLPRAYWEEREPRLVFWDELARRLAERPEVEGVAFSNGRPPSEPGFGNNFLLEDRPLRPGEGQPSVPWVIASPSYFSVLGLRLLDGRMFDADSDGRVAIVDETWARRFYPGERAVGRRFRQGGCTRPDCDRWEVIGVVEDVRYTGIADAGEGTMYLNGRQITPTENFVVVRTTTDEPLAALPALRDLVRELEPDAPVSEVATGRELVRESLQEPRYLSLLIGGFAGVALLLALVGIYGIMVYFVQEHRRGIGIRLALGGTPRSIVALVLRTGLRLVAAGTALGIVVALVLTRYLSSILFEVRPADPVTFAGVAVGLVGLAAAAGYWPARQAAAIDPAGLLRDE